MDSLTKTEISILHSLILNKIENLNTRLIETSEVNKHFVENQISQYKLLAIKTHKLIK